MLELLECQSWGNLNEVAVSEQAEHMTRLHRSGKNTQPGYVLAVSPHQRTRCADWRRLTVTSCTELRPTTGLQAAWPLVPRLRDPRKEQVREGLLKEAEAGT